MAEIRVVQPHSVSRADARARMQDFEQSMSKYGVTSKWSGDSAKLKGMAVNGSIDVSDAEVVVVLKLGMMAKAAGVDPERLQGSISRRLATAFE
jgi:putative polyhydroxyalkanoate system protein